MVAPLDRREQPMPKFTCQYCPSALEIGGDINWEVLLTDFPGDLFGCYLLLTAGPGTVPCPRCSRPNDLFKPHLASGDSGRKFILYLPDGEHALDSQGEARAMKALEQIRRDPSRSELVVARGRHEFRRAFLNTFVAPAAGLLNDFIVADSQLSWIAKNEDKLDASLFGALYLLSQGVAPTFLANAADGPRAPFIPHELAPDEASNVRRRREAEQQIINNVGLLLGHLLLQCAARSGEARSFSSVQQTVPRLFSPPAPGDAITAATAAFMGKIIDAMRASSDTTTLYVLEATLAIFCHAHKVINPRRREWTQIQLLYDLARRRNGDDESLLLDASLIRETIEEAQFWREYRAVGTALGLRKLNAETKPQILQMAETATRVFPEQARKALQLEIIPDDELSEEDLSSDLAKALEALPNQTRLRALFDGLRRNKRQLLRTLISALRSKLDSDPKLQGATKLEVLGLAIEQLNLANYYALSADLAEQLTGLLASEPYGISDGKRGALFNEIGNCFRYQRRFNEALAAYDMALTLVGGDNSKPDRRTGLQNRAIILRELHRYSEARRVFGELRAFADSDERRGLLTSEAVCLVEMGHHREALALLEKNLDLVEGQSASEPRVLAYISLLAALMLLENQLDAAARMAGALDRGAQDSGYLFAQMVAAQIDLSIGLRDGDNGKIDSAIATLHEFFLKMVDAAQIPSLVQGAIEQWNRALLDRGRGKEAEETIRQLLGTLDPAESPKAWFLYMLAAAHAISSNPRQALRDILGAIGHLEAALWTVTRTDDVLALLSPQASVLTDLVRMAFALVQKRRKSLGGIARVAADLRSAPVLTARLRRDIGLSYSTDDIKAERRRLNALLRRTESAILQFVDIGDDVALLQTRLGWLGSTVNIRHVGLAPARIAKLARQVDFALRSADPGCADLGLEALPGWTSLVEKVRSTIEDLPPNLPLYVAAGPVGETVFSLALPDGWPICFIPSVAALVALRTRRDMLEKDGAWRPKRLFDFAVWFEGERPSEVEALAGIVTTGARMAQARSMDYCEAHGTAATQEQLISGLAAADVARLACHGRILPDAEAVDLLVAANGYLPPADLTELIQKDRDPHVVGWQRLADLKQSAAVVFSSACDSGLTVLNPGGERLGLERPLFTAGSVIYVAPLWPVPTIQMQYLQAELLDGWLSSPDFAMGRHVASLRAAAVQRGIVPLAARALGVFGDGF
jgi:tetratricopeptide (TPR) repeat protein